MELKATSDIWFASFLKLQGFEVNNYEIMSKNKGKFFFIIEDDNWKKLKLRFDKSEISKIKLHQIALRDLLY